MYCTQQAPCRTCWSFENTWYHPCFTSALCLLTFSYFISMF
jgi:hypothetical protein